MENVHSFEEWVSEQPESNCDLAERAWNAGRLNLLAQIATIILDDESRGNLMLKDAKIEE